MQEIRVYEQKRASFVAKEMFLSVEPLWRLEQENIYSLIGKFISLENSQKDNKITIQIYNR